MKWEERQGVWFADPYRIYLTTRGEYDCWIYSPAKNGILKRGFITMRAAKNYCENHAAFGAVVKIAS